MEGNRPTTLNCTVVAVDCTCLWYRVCAVCEKNLSDDPSSTCSCCKFDLLNPNVRRSKRLFRILMSIASDSEVFPVICFDRAAKVLLGCSADELFDFAKYHPFAATTVGRVLEGEILRVTLSQPKNGYSQHLRIASVVTLRTGFQPAIITLRKIYKMEWTLSNERVDESKENNIECPAKTNATSKNGRSIKFAQVAGSCDPAWML